MANRELIQVYWGNRMGYIIEGVFGHWTIQAGMGGVIGTDRVWTVVQQTFSGGDHQTGGVW